MCMRASLENVGIFTFLNCYFFQYVVGTNDMLVGLHVPKKFQMYRQNSEKALWGLPPPPPLPPSGYANGSYTNKLKFVWKSEHLIMSCMSEYTPKAKWSVFKVRKANAIISKYWCMTNFVISGTLWYATLFWNAFGCIAWLLRFISRLTAHSD